MKSLREFFRYSAVAGAGLFIDLAIFVIAAPTLGGFWASFTGTGVAGVFNLLLMSKFVFRKQITVEIAARFTVTLALVAIIGSGSTSILLLTRLEPAVAKIISMSIVSATQFIILRKWSFAKGARFDVT